MNFILNCKKIDFTIIDWVDDFYKMDISSFDAVISPCDPIDVSLYPNTKFIFGPQFSIFPDNKLEYIKGNNSIYNLLSEWVVNIWKQYSICDNLKLVKLPFGVDTEKFKEVKPLSERNNVIVYFKHRDPIDLQFVVNFLQNKNIPYHLFSYDQRYNEADYLDCLQNAKYAIWVDAHESQGFAVQEALSSNVPLLVWNVTSMNQEYNSSYSELAATTTSYWDARCGEIFYNSEELEDTYNHFISNLASYKPREFIIENLSVEACENKWIEIIQNM
jgi:glycosyltransferase involved in cell wall biosynthesis